MRELRIASLMWLVAWLLAPLAVQAQRTGGPLSRPSASPTSSVRNLPDAVVLDDEYVDAPMTLDHGIMGEAWQDTCATCGNCSPTGGCMSCGGCLRSNCTYCDRFYVSVDYLIWWQQSMGIPPLITTSTPATTPRNQAGVLGQPNTSVLVGDESLFNDARNGWRVRGGVWLDNQHVFGVEGEYWNLESDAVGFREASDGSTIIARPFFNVLTDQEDSELVSYPGVVRGEALVNADTSIRSAGLRAMINLCCWQGCSTDCVAGCLVAGHASTRWDLLIGYRYTGLDEGLVIREGLVSLLPAPDDGAFNIRDGFATKNDFHGVDIGVRNQWRRTCWELSMLAKVALGSNQQYVAINGSTITTVNGISQPQVGGLLAQKTNIGQYSRNQFSAIPEIGINASRQLTPRLSCSAGYTLAYWFDVVRPPDQIDRRVNTNLLPPPILPLQGEAAPLFAFQETSMWLQGINLGVELRW